MEDGQIIFPRLQSLMFCSTSWCGRRSEDMTLLANEALGPSIYAMLACRRRLNLPVRKLSIFDVDRIVVEKDLVWFKKMEEELPDFVFTLAPSPVVLQRLTR